MTPRTLATLHAAGRVAFGAAMTAAPGPVLGPWVGTPASTPGGRTSRDFTYSSVK